MLTLTIHNTYDICQDRRMISLAAKDPDAGYAHHVGIPQEDMNPATVALMLRALADKLDPKPVHTD